MKRALVLVLAAMTMALIATPGAEAEPESVEPTATGWWRVGPLALVTSAGLADGELLVEGLGPGTETRQAVAALSFPFDEDSAANAELVVPVVSASVPGQQVLLCVVTDDFVSVANGAPEDVPDHDCQSPVTAVISEEGNLTAENVQVLARTPHLRVLLIPADTGRLVLDGAGATLAVNRSVPTTADGPRGTGLPERSFDAPPPAVENPSARPSFDAPSAPVDQPAAPQIKPGPSEPVSNANVAANPTGYRPKSRDTAARTVTAAVVALALCAFTALNRGPTSRLRPATVPWGQPT